ncbi:hypothetical protein Tco_0039136, partial [Tanacetum coccineum]
SSTYTTPSNSNTGSHRSSNVIEDVLQSFVADTDTLVDWTEHDGQSDGVIAPKEFGMIAGCDAEDAIEEGATKIYNLITGADTKEASTVCDAGEFALVGVTSEKNQLTLEDKIRVLSIELENTTNLLKHSERINAIAETAKKELQTKLDNHLVQIEKWRTSSKNLFRLIDSSMSVRTKVGLGFNNYIRENELGWDESAFSVFTTNFEEVGGRPLFNRFAKADSMKAVPLPLSGDYTPLSDHIDLDESQMSYGTKSPTSGDSNSVSNDFVSCDNSTESTTNERARFRKLFMLPSMNLPKENHYSDDEDEGICDSALFRSLTGTAAIQLVLHLQICDKKNRVLFTDTDCLVLSKDFMLPDESMVVLRVPRKHNLYTINLNNLSPRGNLDCLVAKASVDESVKWHRRMGYVNYKNMNRLVKGNQHKALYKAITAVSSISEPLQLLHMDLFGPTSIRSIDHKYYCLVITDDYSREWTEVVSTACYVLNRVLIINPHSKTPYA